MRLCRRGQVEGRRAIGVDAHGARVCYRWHAQLVRSRLRSVPFITPRW
ncbi:hypothetical protein DB30_02041 [Enhygromyxa salina]|uniref:Uncharacterized protein n=1 Tax=Enhygromyxa salina TaxID=215803 RepID=A0A0C2CLH4_9BACT|nr:hypothetical protein DB30_02041 [Enhygromyxa salina]